MVTDSGRPEVSDIFLDVKGISTHPRGKEVTVEATYPLITRMGLMRSLSEKRAKIKALAVVGPVDTTVEKIKNRDVSRFTHISDTELIKQTSRSETREINIVVQTKER